MADKDTGSDSVFDFDRIRSLIELMKEHELSEIDLQQTDQRIKLARATAAFPIAYAAPPAAPSVSVPATTTPASASVSSVDEAHIATIKSPMVGTFYSRPNPNAPDFVTIGSHVTPDTHVCIIEAMKVFNEIPAEVRGKIIAILVKNEEAVDFGKPLFKVDTRG